MQLPLTDKKRNEMFQKADIDNDDLIDYEEFIKSIETIKDDRYVEETFEKVEKLRKAFCKADENNKELISADQFRFLLTI